jgi:hypothetical protein
MRIVNAHWQRRQMLLRRGLDMRRAGEVFASPRFTRAEDRHGYGKLRFVTMGWLEEPGRIYLDPARADQAHYQHEALP